ncbi:hypothetical protein ACFE04_003426 [Oxalis oulophora]
METRLGKDYLQAIKRDGIIDVHNNLIIWTKLALTSKVSDLALALRSVADPTNTARTASYVGNLVLLYASMNNDMHTIVNLYVRINLERGMETRLGKDFMQAIKRDGFIDPAHEKIGVVDTQLIVHQGGDMDRGKPPWQGVRERCRKEWTMIQDRMTAAELQTRLMLPTHLGLYLTLPHDQMARQSDLLRNVDFTKFNWNFHVRVMRMWELLYGKQKIASTLELAVSDREDSFKTMISTCKREMEKVRQKSNRSSRFDISQHITKDAITHTLERALSSGNFDINRFKMHRKGMTQFSYERNGLLTGASSVIIYRNHGPHDKSLTTIPRAGQPKRHLLTTGWSLFVSAKRLVAGDSVSLSGKAMATSNSESNRFSRGASMYRGVTRPSSTWEL